MGRTIYVVKTKVLFSCTATMQLICTFVFAYAKSRFFHDIARMIAVCVDVNWPKFDSDEMPHHEKVCLMCIRTRKAYVHKRIWEFDWGLYCLMPR